MINITIKGLSKEAHRELKRRAAVNGRSLNTEAIAVLEASTRSTPVDSREFLARLRAVRPRMARGVTLAELDRLKREGHG